MQYILYRKVLVLGESEMLIQAFTKKGIPILKYAFSCNGQEEIIYQVMDTENTIKNESYEDKVNTILMCNKRLQSWIQHEI